MAEESELNSQYVSAHPGWFALATLNRIINYWTGAWIKPAQDYPNTWPVIVGVSSLSLLGLLGVFRMFSSGNPAWSMYAACVFLYPLVYYVSTSQPRFYHTIAPLLILSGVFGVLDLKNGTALKWSGKEVASSEASVHHSGHVSTGSNWSDPV
jgi:hypothetical protein